MTHEQHVHFPLPGGVMDETSPPDRFVPCPEYLKTHAEDRPRRCAHRAGHVGEHWLVDGSSWLTRDLPRRVAAAGEEGG
jgi:hypothetical protein